MSTKRGQGERIEYRHRPERHEKNKRKRAMKGRAKKKGEKETKLKKSGLGDLLGSRLTGLGLKVRRGDFIKKKKLKKTLTQRDGGGELHDALPRPTLVEKSTAKACSGKVTSSRNTKTRSRGCTKTNFAPWTRVVLARSGRRARAFRKKADTGSLGPGERGGGQPGRCEKSAVGMEKREHSLLTDRAYGKKTAVSKKKMTKGRTRRSW